MALLEGLRVNLGGREFIVPPLNLKALKLLGPKINGLSALKDVPTSEQVDDIVEVLHAAFLRNYPDISRENLLDMVDLGNLLRIFPAVLSASGLEQHTAGEVRPMSSTGMNSSGSSAQD